MILGIDPGLAGTGWAVLEEEELIDCGWIKTQSNENITVRLGKICDIIERLIVKYKIKNIALENLFFTKNISSAFRFSQTIGAIRATGFKSGIKLFEYTPLQIKSTLVGYGRAEKSQVELMVRNILGIKQPIKPSHTADAIAVALTHLYIKHEV